MRVRHHKRFLLATPMWFLLSMFAASHTAGQINPVRLSVTKNRKVSQNTTYQSPGGTTRAYEMVETVSYTIEVANATTAPVPDVEIQWAILVKPRGKTKLEIVEGKQTCALNLGHKFIFDTDVLELHGSTVRSASGEYRSAHSAQIVGFAVEVFVRGTRVATDIQPPDTKRRIEQVKAEKEKSDARRHRF